MQLDFTRTPESSDSYFAEKTFRGGLQAVRWDGDYWGIQINFSTNPTGRNHSNFRAVINPKQFEELARIMMEADPRAAIRAFGAAMQGAEVARIQDPVGR